MNLQAWKQKFHISLGVITWACFAIIFGIFWGYAFLLKDKELTTQDMLRSEIQYLRKENRQLTERNQQLEQVWGSTSTENEKQQENGPDATNIDSELEEASQRSFVYTVKKGDTIWDIAEMYNIDVKALMRWNNLTPRSRIFPGDQLTIILGE